MVTTSIGLFDGLAPALRALQTLQGCGFSRDEMSVIALQHETRDLLNEAEAQAHGAVSEGRLPVPMEDTALMAAAQVCFLRGIGRVVITGPLSLVLTGAREEDSVRTFLDSLVAQAVSEEQAEQYAEGIRRGGTLLSVSTVAHLADRAEDILMLQAAVNIEQRARRWRQQGWLGFNPTLPPYTALELAQERRWQAAERAPGKDWNPYERDFRSHFYLVYSDNTELPYEHYAPAYCYGYQLARDNRLFNKRWEDIESHVQKDWQRQRADSWQTMADAIYYGFLKGCEHSKSSKFDHQNLTHNDCG
jgi:hypothetical protein